jgi:hypothetical protein
VAVDIHDCLFVCIGDGGDSGDGGYTRWLLDCWMTNLQIESCADELPAHVGVRHRTFIVNTDTCDRGGSHWVAFHFPLVGPTEFFDSLGNAPETYHRRFANVNGPQYYYYPNSTRQHRHLPTAFPVMLQTETSRNEDTILRSNC